jgi:hypothetical protein
MLAPVFSYSNEGACVQRLKLNGGQLLSSFAFNFNLRRHTEVRRVRRPHRELVGRLGRAVQVASMKPTLKAPGIHFLTLKYDESLSTFAFNFKFRRYSLVRFCTHPFWGTVYCPRHEEDGTRRCDGGAGRIIPATPLQHPLHSPPPASPCSSNSQGA